MSKHQLNMRTIMTDAWKFVRENGMKIGDAMRCAWRNFKLLAKMTVGKAYFSFMKKDDTIRVACGTLVSSEINYTPKGTGRPTPPHLQKFWDIDEQGWRCFTRANLITVA